jgi:excisionase family DNA binding protein
METQLEAIYTVPEVADYLKMSKSKVYYLIQRRELPHIKIGRNVRVREMDLKNWIKEQYQEVV